MGAALVHLKSTPSGGKRVAGLPKPSLSQAPGRLKRHPLHEVLPESVKRIDIDGKLFLLIASTDLEAWYERQIRTNLPAPGANRKKALPAVGTPSGSRRRLPNPVSSRALADARAGKLYPTSLEKLQRDWDDA